MMCDNRKQFLKTFLAVLFVCLQIQVGNGFLHKNLVVRMTPPINHASSSASSSLNRNYFLPSSSSSELWKKTTSNTHYHRQQRPLFAGSKTDGTGRGKVIQFFVLVACVWIFSIPPEFRRAKFCPGPRDGSPCVETPRKCSDCVTPQVGPLYAF